METTDHDWESFAKENPYWAVLTQERFRNQNLNEKVREDFFSTGEEHINWIFEVVHKHVAPVFNPQSALDFGCGVGRLVFPLSRRCAEVTGVDVSESMLREAKAAAQSKGIQNVRFVQELDQLDQADLKVDFITSFIVFQHIPCRRGQQLFRQLLDRLNEGGVGAIHFTYSRASFTSGLNDASSFQYDPAYTHPDTFWHHLAGIKRAVRRRLKRSWQAVFHFQQRPRKASPACATRVPIMQMNPYLLNPIFQILQQAGVRSLHLTTTDHAESLGLVLFFQKKKG